jgi:hypothetical protein
MDEMFYGTLPQDTQDFTQVLRGVGRNIGDIARGVSYYPYDVLGAPVDIINMALQPVGLGSQTPVLGSDYLRNIAQSLGYAQPSTGSGAETAGRFGAAFINPAAGARAVGQAGNLVTRGANISADKLVQMITQNPRATAMGVVDETAMPFMQAVAPRVTEQAQQTVAATQSDNFKNWFGDWQADPEMASKVVTDQGTPMVVYHGTQRPDRIGTQFRKSRATSGPMSFFTDDPEIASSYAKGKQDTSLAYEDTDYANWFKKKEGKTTLNLEQVGARMSQQEKQEVLDKLRRVGQDDQGNIVIGEGLVGDQTFDFMLKDPREAGGNPLKLANKLWLESGTLYGREEDFSKVLNAIGLKGFEQDFPTASYPAVYPVYLDIKNPLDTSAIDRRTMYALEWNAKRQRKPAASGGADQWDKRRRDPKLWIEQLKEDMEEGKPSMVWTSIPDWVTKTLKAEGYDGIKDVGGKSGGMPHTVWIPFEENQVKSATGNVGKFSKESKNILRGAVPTAGAGLLGAGMVQDEQMY